MEHKHIAQQQQNGSFAITRDGYMLNCPKTIMLMPVVSQLTSQVEGMQPQQIPCSTMCPFAAVKRLKGQVVGGVDMVDKETDVYEISCEGGLKKIALDEIRMNNAGKNGLVKTM